MILNSYLYESSDGIKKDVRELDYQYLVNALAKCYRSLNDTPSKAVFIRCSDNVIALTDELKRRNDEYYVLNFKEEN